MAEVTNELMFELLKRIQGDLSDLRHTLREHTGEFVALRKHMGAFDQRLGAYGSDLENVFEKLQRMDVELSRIARRLDIVTETTG